MWELFVYRTTTGGLFLISILPSIVTLAVGLFAFFLYKKQLGDQKSEAAKIILLEIQNAETGFRLINQSLAEEPPVLPVDIVVLPTQSWGKFKHLFVEDFDRSQWDAISSFYSGCQLLDEVLKDNNSHFQKNEDQFRINIQKISSDYISEALEKGAEQIDTSEIERGLSQKISKLMGVYLRVAQQYGPRKPVLDAKRIITGIDSTLSRTSVGTVLKKLSNQS